METQVAVADKFSEFYNTWLRRLNDIFQLLLRTSNQTTLTEPDQLQFLISNFTSHFKEYYTVKWACAHQSVFPFFCPTWLTDLQNACSWVTGWKPTTAFLLVDSMRKSGRLELTAAQVGEIEKLRGRVRLEEERVERDMERQQVAMADRKMVELARKGEVEAGQVAVALKGVTAGLERIMKAADCVRLKTLKGVLDALSPGQAVVFLAASCMLHFQLWQLGKRIQAQRTLKITKRERETAYRTVSYSLFSSLG